VAFFGTHGSVAIKHRATFTKCTFDLNLVVLA